MFVRSSCLIDMCLNVIVNNLEVIVNSEKIPQKSVDYSLHWYSGRVYNEYRKLNKVIKEDVMLWFLNPHAKEFILHRKLFTTKIVDRLLSIGKGITSLNLHRSSVPENVLNVIVGCVPCVKILDLSHTSCTDTTLSVIRETCADLEDLNLSCCENITDDGLENLCGTNQSLKTLDLRYSGVEGFGALIILNRIPSLECIRFEDFSDILVEMYNPHWKYNITQLVYDGMDHPEAIRKLTKMCPKIKKLHFQSPVKKKVLKECARFQQLEELKFKVSHRTSNDVRMCNFLAPILPISVNLKTLILSCLQIPTAMLIEHFRNLEKLYLKKVSFQPFRKENIKCTENRLDVLVIKSTDMEVSSTTYQAITLLISLSRNVTKLDLSHNRELPPDLFDVILNSMKHLSSVSFYCTHVKINCLIPFFYIPSLKMINARAYDEHDNYVKPKLPPKSSSTLSWRYVCDEDSDDESPLSNDGFNPDDCDSDSTDHDSMNDSVISDGCDSDRSTPDRYHYFPDAFGAGERMAMSRGYYADSEESD